MSLFKYLKSIFVRDKNEFSETDKLKFEEKEILEDNQKIYEIREFTERFLTVSQAAKKNNLTRQAIFFAIKTNRLNAKKENGIWLITEKDLNEYFNQKYSRSKSKREDELIFDKSKGFYSISEAADFLGKKTNHIYYLVRMGKLKSHRRGAAIVIIETDLQSYSEFHTKKEDKKSVCI